MNEIVIKNGREKSIHHHHPWIFSGSISRVNGTPDAGETVDVISQDGEFLARAAYNAHSQISCRIWTWDSKEEINPGFFEKKLRASIQSRVREAHLIRSDAIRFVHAESDGLPGLILDQYGDVAVVQFLSAGVEYWKESLIDLIRSITGCSILYERSDVDVRQLEGLELKKGLLYGQDIVNPVMITENGVQLVVDIIEGHKTGYYLDQRDNRALVRNISDGRKVLDCFSYSGGFAINSLLGNAKDITLVDSSKIALDYARQNMLTNQISTDRAQYVEEDVFKYLRALRDRNEKFDLIILDPPKFAPTVAQAEKAARGYKDINLLALKMLKPNGYLLTFSCSGGVSEELFQKIIAGAAFDAGVAAVILKRLHQAIDHPVGLNFPEGAYLKGFLIQKTA